MRLCRSATELDKLPGSLLAWIEWALSSTMVTPAPFALSPRSSATPAPVGDLRQSKSAAAGSWGSREVLSHISMVNPLVGRRRSGGSGASIHSPPARSDRWCTCSDRAVTFGAKPCSTTKQIRHLLAMLSKRPRQVAARSPQQLHNARPGSSICVPVTHRSDIRLKPLGQSSVLFSTWMGADARSPSSSCGDTACTATPQPPNLRKAGSLHVSAPSCASKINTRPWSSSTMSAREPKLSWIP